MLRHINSHLSSPVGYKMIFVLYVKVILHYVRKLLRNV
jgi:hypothetical protein